MNRFFLLLTLILLFMKTAIAQKLNTDISNATKSYKYYMNKRNTNNTIGWVCLGTGLTMGGVGVLEFLGGAFGGNIGSSDNPKGSGLYVAGNLVTLASIPFL